MSLIVPLLLLERYNYFNVIEIIKWTQIKMESNRHFPDNSNEDTDIRNLRNTTIKVETYSNR